MRWARYGSFVDLLYAGEFVLVAFGEPLRVHPEREAGALELSGEAGLSGLAGVVPDFAADLVGASVPSLTAVVG